MGVAVMFFLLSKVDNPFPIYQENSLLLLQSFLDAGRTVSGPLAVAELFMIILLLYVREFVGFVVQW